VCLQVGHWTVRSQLLLASPSNWTGLVAQGLSNRQVAGEMFLSVHTVAFHLRHIFCKLGLTSRYSWPGLPRRRQVRDLEGELTVRGER
jgi:hypothetical protein